jgi:hypothetical protein
MIAREELAAITVGVKARGLPSSPPTLGEISTGTTAEFSTGGNWGIFNRRKKIVGMPRLSKQGLR